MFYIAGINLVVATALLVLVEGCVRLSHPEIRPLGTDATLIQDSVFASVQGPRPGGSGTSNGARFTASPRGFWEYADQPEHAGAAWLFLGDSVTMGVGVEPDQTFVGLLAAQQDDVRVLNPSLMGYSIKDYVDILEVVLSRRNDVRRVTVVWCLNDIYGRADGAADPEQDVRRSLGAVLGFIHRNIYTYQWVKAVLSDRPRRYFEHDAALYDGQLLDSALDQLSHLATTCASESLRCEIVLLPYEYQLRSADREEVLLPQRRLTEITADLGLPVYNPMEFLLQEKRQPSDLFLYGDGIHFSREGHRLLARFFDTIDTSDGVTSNQR